MCYNYVLTVLRAVSVTNANPWPAKGPEKLSYLNSLTSFADLWEQEDFTSMEMINVRKTMLVTI